MNSLRKYKMLSWSLKDCPSARTGSVDLIHFAWKIWSVRLVFPHLILSQRERYPWVRERHLFALLERTLASANASRPSFSPVTSLLAPPPHILVEDHALRLREEGEESGEGATECRPSLLRGRDGNQFALLRSVGSSLAKLSSQVAARRFQVRLPSP